MWQERELDIECQAEEKIFASETGLTLFTVMKRNAIFTYKWFLCVYISGKAVM